jgi:hypothetical protein
MSVVLLIKHDIVYRGLVADTASDVCLAVTVTDVPHAACRVCRTSPVAVSFRKSIVMLDAF